MSIIVANTGDLDAVRAAIGRLRGFNRALTKSGSADSLQSHDDAGMSMALGRQGGRQAELMVGWAELPRSPGHAFYDRLQAILIEAEFDRFAEHACAPYYAGRRGRPSLPPGRYFRMVDATRRWSATSRGSTASAGWSGAAPTACPCASSCAWAPRSRCRTIRGLCGRPRKAKPILASPQRRAAQAKRTEGLRRFVEAVVYVLRTGVAWEDLPERSGKPNSLYRCFRRWSRQGIWDALFASGIPEDELETVMVDATITKAQRFASGARGSGEEDLGRSRGGLTTKIHVLVDRRCRPLGYLLTPGQAADCRHAATLLEGVSFACLIGDRAHDTDALRAWCAGHGVKAVIPAKRNRKTPIPHDRARYRTRHQIENLFGRVKDYTRIILRKDKTSCSYTGFVSLAFARVNSQLCP